MSKLLLLVSILQCFYFVFLQNALEDMDKIKAELADLEKQEQDFKKKEDELAKKEKVCLMFHESLRQLVGLSFSTVGFDLKQKVELYF